METLKITQQLNQSLKSPLPAHCEANRGGEVNRRPFLYFKIVIRRGCVIIDAKRVIDKAPVEMSDAVHFDRRPPKEISHMSKETLSIYVLPSKRTSKVTMNFNKTKFDTRPNLTRNYRSTKFDTRPACLSHVRNDVKLPHYTKMEASNMVATAF